jgi:magnesium-transporting ATPase (P-type)
LSELRDKSKEQNQSSFDFVLEHLTFGFLGAVAGLVYAGVICVTLLLLKVEVSSKPLLNSFILVFGFFGVVLGQNITPIIMSTIYGLMYLWGVLLGFIGYESSYFLHEEHLPKKSEYFWCVMLGVFAVTIFISIK